MSKQINLEADFSTKDASAIVTQVMKFVGAGTNGDGRATAEEILKAYGYTRTEVDNLFLNKLNRTYAFRNVDLTASAGIIAQYINLEAGKTFIMDQVHVHAKDVTNYTVIGDFAIGFSLESDIPSNTIELVDSLYDVALNIPTKRSQIADTSNGRVSTGSDVIYGEIITPATATILTADIIVDGFEL